MPHGASAEADELLGLLREARKRAAWLKAARARLHQAKIEHDEAAAELEAFLAGTGPHARRLRTLLAAEGLHRIARVGKKGLMAEAEFRALWAKGGAEAVIAGHLHPIRRKVVIQRAKRLGLHVSPPPAVGWLDQETFLRLYREGGIDAVLAASPPGTRRVTLVLRARRLTRAAPSRPAGDASPGARPSARSGSPSACAAARRSRPAPAPEDR